MAKRVTHKGRPSLILNPEQPYYFAFGTKRAEMILQNILDIVDFVDEFGNPELVAQFWEVIDKQYEDVCDVEVAP